MKPKTFIEKILGAPEGAVVFRKPDIILTHDNTSSIYQTFRKMGGEKVFNPAQMLVVLDHNAPPADAKLATQYQDIGILSLNRVLRSFMIPVMGICHQLMSYHARPGMIIVGSDSHTCTAGAFNALAAGIDRTEAAGIWKSGETWFLVPPSMRIDLKGKLAPGVSAKDLSLWIIGMLGSDGANYMSIEFHGEGVRTLSISDRMTVANLASEMGAKNAVFPADDVSAEIYRISDTAGYGLMKEQNTTAGYQLTFQRSSRWLLPRITLTTSNPLPPLQVQSCMRDLSAPVPTAGLKI